MLDFLATVSTLQVVDPLPSSLELVRHLVLLALQSLKLEQADATRVQLVNVNTGNVNTLDSALELLELLLRLFALHALAFGLDPTLITILSFLRETLGLSGLQLLLLQLALLLLLALSSGFSMCSFSAPASARLRAASLSFCLSSLKDGSTYWTARRCTELPSASAEPAAEPGWRALEDENTSWSKVRMPVEWSMRMERSPFLQPFMMNFSILDIGVHLGQLLEETHGLGVEVSLQDVVKATDFWASALQDVLV
ncbi:hypothetical protein KC363_g92 [Hortaea werneckii]|nr:hypothetical protein KC363_g92 [Hortaea werneckii]